MKRALTLFVFVCLPLVSAHAQSTTVAQVSGTVLDQAGGVIVGAQVQITNTDTNAARTAQTNDTGAYVFPDLDIGPYKLQVTAQGFTTYVQTGIVLQANTNPAVDVTLKPGAMTQTVEVQADAAMVETQSNGVNTVIQPEQVLDLPLNGRQATSLIALSGAATPGASGGTVNTLDYPSAVQISIAGSQGNATNYYLDGSVNMDFRTNVGLPMPFPDALQEFSVQSSALPANLGSRPGGSVNAAVKSGTNSIHGDLFEFLRNGVLDADVRTYTNTSGVTPAGIRDNLKQNQFGGTIGGPIIRNKIFFFTGIQGTTQRQQSQPAQSRIPVAANLAPTFDFSNVLSKTCSGASNPGFINATFAVNNTPGTAVQPQFFSTPSALIAAKILNFLPPPSAAIDSCGDYQYAQTTHNNEYQGVLRIDWQRTQNDTVFFRYFVTNYYSAPYLQKDSQTPSGYSLLGANVGLADQAQSVDIGDTHILGPRAISSLRLSFARTGTNRTSAAGIPTIESLGCNCTSQVANQIGVFVSAPGNLGYDYENIFGVSETLGWNVRSHQLSMGFTFLHVQMNNDGVFQMNPSMSFGSNDTYTVSKTTGQLVDSTIASVTGSSLADFLTGNADGLSQGNGQLGRDAQNQPSLFVQDNWKVTRRFQVNAGLRWDPFIPQYNKYKEASDFSLAGFTAGTKSAEYLNAPPGLTFPGDSTFNERSDTEPRVWDFSPRVGIVWDPRGNGKETVRAGYGVFYDTSVLWNTMHIVLNPPWGETLSITPGTVAQGGGIANPWVNYPGGNPFPTPFQPPSNFAFPLAGAYVFENQYSKPENVQQWNLALQKQFGGNWLVSATYIGNKGTHAWIGHNLDYTEYLSQYGTSAPCDLPFLPALTGVATLHWAPCNGNSTKEAQTINLPNNQHLVVTNYTARKVLNLINPDLGPYFGSLVQDQSDGDSAYNGLLLSAQHRLSDHFSISANFTWSRCMDDAEIGQDIGSAGQNPAIPKDWGNCGSDERKVFNLSTVLQSPKMKERYAQMILGNWNASGIYTAHTGNFTSVSDGTDIALTGGTDRPNQVGNPFQNGPIAANSTCTPPTGSFHTLNRWWNPCAFEMEPAGTYGNEVRNSLPEPGNWNLDAAIWRTFPIGERFKLDFRAEAFNVFNHVEIGNPATSLSGNICPCTATSWSTSVARIGSSSGANRIMQGALKLSF